MPGDVEGMVLSLSTQKVWSSVTSGVEILRSGLRKGSNYFADAAEDSACLH